MLMLIIQMEVMYTELRQVRQKIKMHHINSLTCFPSSMKVNVLVRHFGCEERARKKYRINNGTETFSLVVHEATGQLPLLLTSQCDCRNCFISESLPPPPHARKVTKCEKTKKKNQSLSIKCLDGVFYVRSCIECDIRTYDDMMKNYS